MHTCGSMHVLKYVYSMAAWCQVLGEYYNINDAMVLMFKTTALHLKMRNPIFTQI